MKNSSSFTLKTFLEQWLPRLIALSIFAYLIWSLFFKQDTLSGLHITALAIIAVLILAPMSSRLRLFNFIDFSSKLNGVMQEQQETKRELNELRNQISTFVSTRVSPVQVVTMNGSKVLRELLADLRRTETQTDSDMSMKKDDKYTREGFLRKAYGYCHVAFALLMLTLSFQVAVREHRGREPTDVMDGNTMSEKISNMIKRILDNDLETVFPLYTIDDNSGKKTPVITPEVKENLQLVNSLIDLYQRIEKGEIELPSHQDIYSLFDKVGDVLIVIGASLEAVATQSILYQYRMTSAIEGLKREIKQADIDQRPINIPPPNSDEG